MQRTWFMIGLVLLFSTAACAQKLIPEQLLLTSGQYIGSGARALGMAGTYTGIADDYSSIWWNPAGLAQVKRIEMQGSLSRTGFSNESNYFGGSADGSTSSLRLNNAGVVLPVPVYQGALSFAFGYTQVQAYEFRNRVSTTDTTSDFSAYDAQEAGRLGFWTFAAAMDVSQNIALGLGINYWTGLDEYTWTGYERAAGNAYSEQSVSTDLSGWGLNVGTLFRIGNFARLGAMFQTPVSMTMEEDWQDGEDNGYLNYRMTYPAVFRVGASVCPGRWLLAADVEYRDWSTLEFRSDTPYDSVSRASGNQQIKNGYQSTTRLSVGGEYLFPVYGIRARAGYSYEPSSYEKNNGKDDRNILSFGLGVLVDRSVMIDAAFQTTSYKEIATTNLTKDISTTTALVSLSYRM
jgi:long-subunit fatty acid transport protein